MPIAVPWLLPACRRACALGFAVHPATVEVSHGVASCRRRRVRAGISRRLRSLRRSLLASPSTSPSSRARAQLRDRDCDRGDLRRARGRGLGTGGLRHADQPRPAAADRAREAARDRVPRGYLGGRASKLRWQRRRFLGLRWPRLELLVPALGVLVLIVAGLYVIGDLGSGPAARVRVPRHVLPGEPRDRLGRARALAARGLARVVLASCPDLARWRHRRRRAS